MRKPQRRTLSLFVIAMCAVALNAPATHALAYTNDYTPTEQALQEMSADEARAIVKRELSTWWIKPANGDGAFVSQVKVDLSRIEIVDSSARTITLALSDTPIVVNFFNPKTMDQYKRGHYVDIGDVHTAGKNNLSPDEIKRFVNALYVLKNYARNSLSPEHDAKFEDVVRTYRQASAKPEFPEDARRFKVQAESAVKDADFAGAALLYEQALANAPWWPEGHFNRALVLSEINELSLAMVEMKRYIMLVPDAPDARTAQDKIYEWERKANMAASGGVMPSPTSSPRQ